MQQLLILAGAGLIAIGVLTKPKNSDSVQSPDAKVMPTTEKAKNEQSIDLESDNLTSSGDGVVAPDLGISE